MAKMMVIARFMLDEDDEQDEDVDAQTLSGSFGSFMGPVGEPRSINGWRSTLMDLIVQHADEPFHGFPKPLDAES